MSSELENDPGMGGGGGVGGFYFVSDKTFSSFSKFCMYALVNGNIDLRPTQISINGVQGLEVRV